MEITQIIADPLSQAVARVLQGSIRKQVSGIINAASFCRLHNLTIS